MTHQICKSCNTNKCVSDFEWQKNRPNPRKICKQCRYAARDQKLENYYASTRKAEWREAHKNRLRRNWERTKYGVAKEDLVRKACAICGSTKRLSIDHDHATGIVRDLLCSPCNIAVGFLRDNQSIAHSVAAYIGQHRNDLYYGVCN